MEATLDKFEKNNQKGRKTGRKEKSNVFTENLNESDNDIECLDEEHVIVDGLSGVSCVSMKSFNQFKFCNCDLLNKQNKYFF